MIDRNGSDMGAGPHLQGLILGYLMSGNTGQQMDPLLCSQEVFTGTELLPKAKPCVQLMVNPGG